MPIPSYTTGYPPDESSLGQTKTVIRNNLDGTFQAFSVDHENQNAPDGFPVGVHKQSTYPNLGANPTTLSGQLALYSKAVTGGSALFMVRDGNAGTVTQLTSPAFTAPSISSNGYTFLPGGLILQWGKVNSTSNGVVTYNTSGNITFPNNCFIVTAQPLYTGADPNGGAEIAIKKTASGFTWVFFTSSGSYSGFDWVSIGN